MKKGSQHAIKLHNKEKNAIESIIAEKANKNQIPDYNDAEKRAIKTSINFLYFCCLQ